jgi:mRNA-degrading endonuclease YafQ of YafQ-DinJ toxin-antitoxin module
MVDAWTGFRTCHVYRDDYRVVWEVAEERKTVLVHLTGPRFGSGGSIYDQAAPISGL